MMHKGFTVLLILIIASTALIGAQGVSEGVLADTEASASRYDSYAGKSVMSPAIVASTSWVGAIVRAAGATRVQVLAPIELRHPPEYDFSPQDIIQASRADLVFWAGYEGFIRNLTSAARIADKQVVQVQTNNAPDVLADSVSAVAALLGTTDHYQRWKLQLDEISSAMLDGAQQTEVEKITVAVQFHQQSLIRYLGYDVIAVFGPQELSLRDVTMIEALNPDIIIDNWHSPQGQPFDRPTRRYVQLINFPGPFGTETLIDVLAWNASKLGLL